MGNGRGRWSPPQTRTVRFSDPARHRSLRLDSPAVPYVRVSSDFTRGNADAGIESSGVLLAIEQNPLRGMVLPFRLRKRPRFPEGEAVRLVPFASTVTIIARSPNLAGKNPRPFYPMGVRMSRPPPHDHVYCRWSGEESNPGGTGCRDRHGHQPTAPKRQESPTTASRNSHIWLAFFVSATQAGRHRLAG